MATIRSSIELYDAFSAPLANIISAVDSGVAAMDQMQAAMSGNIDTTPLQAVEAQIDSVISAARQLDSTLQNVSSPSELSLPEINGAGGMEIPVSPALTGQPEIDASPVDIPVNPTVTNQPQIDVPQEINIPVTPIVENQPEINIPDGVDVPVTPIVTEQPQIDAPEDLTVSVTPIVEETEPIQIDAPAVDIPVTPYITEQIQLDLPQETEIPVTPTITEQPEIDVSPVEVPVTPVLDEQLDLGLDIPTPEIPPLDTGNVTDYQAQIESLAGMLQQVSSIQATLNEQGRAFDLPDETRSQFATISRQIEEMGAQLSYARENLHGWDAGTIQLQITALNDSILRTAESQRALNEQIQGMSLPPEMWQSDTLPIFTNTGIERFQSEIQSANSMLHTLNETQSRITAAAASANIFPDNMLADLGGMETRLQAIQNRIEQIENNPLNLGTDEANRQLEQLRSQLHSAIEAQEALNNAVDGMDIQAANEAYLRLSNIVAGTESHIRDNVDEQGQFNRAIEEGVDDAFDLKNMIAGAIGVYASLQGLSSILDIADELSQTTSRLNMMNDGLQSTQDLMSMVYQSAQNARGSFQDMADVVARFGNNAGEAFSSSAEVVAFSELVQKQMTIAGASTEEASNAMLQLSQALGSGVLRGDELNSIFEQAPNLIRSIADYLNVPIGTIREMAAEGELTADIVKAAIFAATDEINANFAAMPMTWGQMWQSMENTALMAFQPIAERISDLANNPVLINFAFVGINYLAAAITEIFDMVAALGSFIVDYWDLIAPAVGGAAAALLSFVGALTIYNAIQTISAAITAAKIIAEYAHAAATGVAVAATTAQTAAQMGLNTALLACPITWIVAAVIGLIVALYAGVAILNRFAGTSLSATGIICAAFMVMYAIIRNVVILPLWNLFAMFANFIGNVFNNPIAAVEVAFYDMCLTVIGYIQNLAAAIETLLNKIPGVTVDITSGLDSFYNGLAEAQSAVKDQAGWVEYVGRMDYMDLGDAANAGYSFGEGVADSISNFDPASLMGDMGKPVSPEDFANAMTTDGGLGDDLGGGVGDTAGHTGRIADELSDSEEDLKYLRDIAEQEAINRFTTAEIHIEQNNNNSISTGMDLDGVTNGLINGIEEAMSIAAEGVHV